MTGVPDLSVNVGGVAMANPVCTASGTFGYALEFAQLLPLSRLGAILVKGLSLAPSRGNPPPRIVETASGMLNAIGLENVGFDAFVQHKLPALARLGPPILVNIYGTRVEEYAELAARAGAEPGIAGIEVNISCPNVKAGGVAFGVVPEMAARVTRAVRDRTDKPVIVKLSPNVTSITEIARAVADAGASALSLINTLAGMAVDVRTRRPRLANVTGGLSGPAIKPVALRMVYEVCRAVDVPVMGVGGILTAEDALEFLLVGATAVQVGTANFVNPRATVDILDGIAEFLAREGCASVREFTGSLSV